MSVAKAVITGMVAEVRCGDPSTAEGRECEAPLHQPLLGGGGGGGHVVRVLNRGKEEERESEEEGEALHSFFCRMRMQRNGIYISSSDGEG